MSETFLSRWSRRKRASTSPRERGESLPPGEDPRVDAPERSEGASDEGAAPHAEPVERAPHPDPLPASGEREPLPPIDSIEAGTDVSAFLRPGVPADLAQAALRRAWVADPAVRDFVGLAENAWDFNAPGGVPGFGPLRAIDDVQRLAAHVAGVVSAVTPETAVGEIAAAAEPAPREAMASALPDVEASAPPDAAVQRDPGSDEPDPPRPRHGGALPE